MNVFIKTNPQKQTNTEEKTMFISAATGICA
jgi:hypothetical protein